MIPIRVYGADLRRVPAEACCRLLDKMENARADAMTHQSARLEFIKARALLRLALAANWPGRQVHDFTFAMRENGKPHLADSDRLHFNVSHSGDMALIAVAAIPVGVDIERKDESIDHLGVAESVFSASERHILLKAPKAERSNVFFSLWTRKEAYLKATGHGFSSHLDLISTALPNGKIEDKSQPSGSTPWYAFDLPVMEGYKAALVTRSIAVDISMLNVPDVLSDAPGIGQALSPIPAL